VACEGVPALFSFRLGASVPGYAIPLDGNALDLAIIRTSTGPLKLAVSIDNIQKPGSTTEVREDTVSFLRSISWMIANMSNRHQDCNTSQDNKTVHGTQMQSSQRH